MMVMVVGILVIFGLCLGSFVNALVWRLHEQARTKNQKPKTKKLKAKVQQHKASKNLSIVNGRSICPDCKHQLAIKDLLPVLSWLTLGGKCRYCGKPISLQYPMIELLTAILFVASYIWWPIAFNTVQITLFVVWLMLLVGLIALLVYDLHWKLLPTRIMYPLSFVAAVYAVISIAIAARPITALFNVILAVLVGGGIFYILFQVSGGKWIGGGDVRLGWLLGLILGTPARSLLLIFMAAVLGSLVSLPLLATNRLKRTSTIPFGPFLISAAVIIQLFGMHILHWYQNMLFSG
jgi:prepilin signal peptidase PulO-like enzyme (type II secretory pathway)